MILSGHFFAGLTRLFLEDRRFSFRVGSDSVFSGVRILNSGEFMVHKLDGNLKLSAHLWSEIGNLIC